MSLIKYGTTWWGQQWLNALSGIDFSNRIARGKSYANNGMVRDFEIIKEEDECIISAKVKGHSYSSYKVYIILPKISNELKDKFIDAIIQSPLIISRLSARELDPSVLEIAENLGINIFPKTWHDFVMKCSCPDYAVPCKHLAAVIYIISMHIDANPFFLFELRNIDIINELTKRGFEFDKINTSEIPTLNSLFKNINEASLATDSTIPAIKFTKNLEKTASLKDYSASTQALQSLSNLTFTSFPNVLDSICELYAEAPAGYIYGSLRKNLKDVMSKAAIVASKQLKDNKVRDLPSFNIKYPIVKIDKNGKFIFHKSLSWTIYENADDEHPVVKTMPSASKTNAQVIQPQNNAFDLFSGYFSENSFENSSDELEALYYIWVIATKLIINGNVIPQLYTPKENTFAVRWIPVIFNPSIAKIINEVANNLQHINIQLLSTPTDNGEINNHDLALAYLSLFITSYIEQGYYAFLGNKQGDPSNECEVLFRHAILDSSKKKFGATIILGLENWLAPLFMLNQSKATPVLLLSDLRNLEENEIDVDDNDFNIEDEQTKSSINLSFGYKNLTVGADLEETSNFIDIYEILNNDDYKDYRFDCLRTMSRISSICPSLYTVLTKNQDTESPSELSFSDLTVLMHESMQLLDLLGINVIIPKSLKKLLSLNSSLTIDIAKKHDHNLGFVNLASLLEFNWKIAMGKHPIKEADFALLCSRAGQMIRFNNEFVYIDPKTILKLQKQKDKQRKLNESSLLKAILTQSFEDSNVILTQQLKECLANIFREYEVEKPTNLNAKLRPYQERGYAWLYRNLKASIGTILADDMGLGKTLQTITLLQKFKEEGLLKDKKVLIVMPTTLLSNWAHELTKFAPNIKFEFFYGSKRTLSDDTDLILTSYGTMRSDIKTLSKQEYSIVIIDEAQAIKNRNTATFKAIRTIKAHGRIALSGTPVENRLLEYWSIMEFANPGLLGSADNFIKEFAKPIEFEHNKNALFKFKQITAPFIMRRLKTDKSIISDLPEKIMIDEYCSLTAEQTALYQEVVDQTFEKLNDNTSSFERSGLVLQLMLKLKQICNSPYQYLINEEKYDSPLLSGKVQRLKELLQSIKDNKKKAIIFTQFTTMGKLLQKWLSTDFCNKEEIPFLHGELSLKARTEMVDKFQNDRSTRFMILSLKAAGTGLNLTAAANVIHFDLWWNPAVENQATDRAYRIGQKENVQVYRFITSNTFEEKINNLIQNKKELADMAVGTGESWIGDLSKQQIKDIFTLSNKNANQ